MLASASLIIWLLLPAAAALLEQTDDRRIKAGPDSEQRIQTNPQKLDTRPTHDTDAQTIAALRFGVLTAAFKRDGQTQPSRGA